MLQIPCQRIMDQNFQLMTMIMIALQNVVLVPHHMEEDGGFTGKTHRGAVRWGAPCVYTH